MFTHASWAAERAPSYERHEFLGDSVLELAIAHELFDRYPDFSEGRLAKIRSHVVSRASCAVVARDLGLGLRLADNATDAQPEELERLTRNRNVLAALLEALREEIAATTTGKLGGLLIRPATRRLRTRLDPDTYGGAYLLGLRGLAVIAHGNSSRRAIANAIRLAARGVEHDVVGRLAARLPERAKAV